MNSHLRVCRLDNSRMMWGRNRNGDGGGDGGDDSGALQGADGRGRARLVRPRVVGEPGVACFSQYFTFSYVSVINEFEYLICST